MKTSERLRFFIEALFKHWLWWMLMLYSFCFSCTLLSVGGWGCSIGSSCEVLPDSNGNIGTKTGRTHIRMLQEITLAGCCFPLECKSNTPLFTPLESASRLTICMFSHLALFPPTYTHRDTFFWDSLIMHLLLGSFHSTHFQTMKTFVERDIENAGKRGFLFNMKFVLLSARVILTKSRCHAWFS